MVGIYGAMNTPFTILGIPGSLRKGSYNLFALRSAQQLLPVGVVLEIFDLHGRNSWRGKPAGIAGASTGVMGTSRAQYQLRQTLVFLNIHPVDTPEVLIGSAAQQFDKEGNVIGENTRELMKDLLQRLVRWARQLEKSRQALDGPS